MKHKNIICALCLILFLLAACDQQKKEPISEVARDTSISKSNSFSKLFLDSSVVENFFKTEKIHDSLATRMRNFYRQRNYQYAWVLEDGLADYATGFVKYQDDYVSYSRDSAIYRPTLGALIDSIAVNGIASFPASTIQNAELALTAQFFRYVYRAYQGRNSLNSKELAWYIPRKRVDIEAALDSLISNKGKNVERYEPANRQYSLLRDELIKYHSFQSAYDSIPIKASKKIYKLGESSPDLVNMKRRLNLVGDLPVADTSALFTPALKSAVISYQSRHGMDTNGIINTSVLIQLTSSIRARIDQMLVNLERIKWIPVQPETDYILVNIPEYRLHVYEKGNYQWSMNVVVGTAVNNTVIFTGTLKNVVFAPYWNVTPSIIKKEILPAMKKDKNYLEKHRMEWNGGNVRQKPGPGNSLGQVKFLFPNSYNIYLHDTPAKDLFGESKRAFSHGCVRLGEPRKLAEWVLRNDPNWNFDKIKAAMNSTKERFVSVKEDIPVFIGYFTSWVDRKGKLNFRDDIYGHDKKMSEKLFTSR